MSIKPPIKCPPDYSILSFRLTECKKVGVVKGISTQLAVDMQDFFVPVTNFEESKITLKAGETKQINISSIGETWPLRESYTFTANPAYCGYGTSHSYSLYDSSLLLIETITFTVDPAHPTFSAAFNNAILNSTYIKNAMSFIYSNFATDGKITVNAITKGVKYRHLFSFDLTGNGGYSPFPFVHPGNLFVPNVKYPNGAIKIMMIYPDYYKANVLSNCGCIDASGDMKSNKKYIEYSFDGDVNKINNPITPILINPNPTVLPSIGFTWQFNSTDHIGYHVKVGDLISLTSDLLLRGIVTSIDGYNILIDTEIGNNSASQIISHVWSPSTITWRKMGDFFLHTTAQDVTDDDRLYIETLWLRNPHSYDLPIKIVMSS